MAILEDASSPAVFRSATDTTAQSGTSASFTPPAGSWLVAMCVNNLQNVPTSQPTLSISDSLSGAWTTLQNTPGAFSNSYPQAAVFGQFVSTGGQARTVTFNRGGTATADFSFAVKVLTGASGFGNVGSLAVRATTAMTTSVTTTKAGSVVYIAGGLGNQETLTANANTTNIDLWDDGTNVSETVLAKSAAPTATPGATTFGWTRSGSASVDMTMALVEVLPAFPIAPPFISQYSSYH